MSVTWILPDIEDEEDAREAEPGKDVNLLGLELKVPEIQSQQFGKCWSFSGVLVNFYVL